MSEHASKERKEYRGERLAQAIQWVRRGGVTSHADCELLVEEIDRLRGDLANAMRHQAPHDCEQWLEDARICRRCSAVFRSSVNEGSLREISRLERELDMARAARNVALDKLVQIARIVSPDDFEEWET